MVVGRVLEHELPMLENVLFIDNVNRIEGFFALLLFTLIIIQLIRSNRHLKEISDKLEYANKELESFSYSAAHDLRAPLAAIKGFSQIITEDYADKLDTDGQECMKKISESAEKMSTLIDDILRLSKISLHQINLQNVNMSSIAESVVDDLKKSFPQRNAEIKIQKELWVKGDVNLIQIVLTNLIGNAWKYSSKIKKAVIRFGLIERNERTVYFISDNGAGFDMNKMNKLFKPFQRLHPENEFPGTGVGLSIVERIIRRHGGKIWAESKQGEGATFYFTLPELR
jgi:light-regulated signal transduction histidine kinase (bacteriophytochrome)